jgi:hypothetical protein
MITVSAGQVGRDAERYGIRNAAEAVKRYRRAADQKFNAQAPWAA